MSSAISEYRLFLREFLRAFHTTGAILPSGPRLAAALTRFVAEKPADDRPRRILEVGPGTGPVTRRIVEALGPNDQLDLVELNEHFVANLRERFQTDPSFMAVADRVQIIHDRIESVSRDAPYDVIVSGLPLNNFSVSMVEDILTTLRNLLAPEGTLSFFQYVAVRHMRTVVSGKQGRKRMVGIGRALDNVLVENQIRRDLVVSNVPPAWVHHVRWASEDTPAGDFAD